MADFQGFKLDHFIRYLDHPLPSEQIKGNRSCSQRITQISSSLFKFFAKTWNLLFGDHKWYSSHNARRILQLEFQDPKRIEQIRPTDLVKLKEINRLLNFPVVIREIEIKFREEKTSSPVLENREPTINPATPNQPSQSSPLPPLPPSLPDIPLSSVSPPEKPIPSPISVPSPIILSSTPPPEPVTIIHPTGHQKPAEESTIELHDVDITSIEQPNDQILVLQDSPVVLAPSTSIPTPIVLLIPVPVPPVYIPSQLSSTSSTASITATITTTTPHVVRPRLLSPEEQKFKDAEKEKIKRNVTNWVNSQQSGDSLEVKEKKEHSAESSSSSTSFRKIVNFTPITNFSRVLNGENYSSLLAVKQEKIDKLFYHLNAHRFGENSSLEGSEQSIFLDFLWKYLTVLNEKSPEYNSPELTNFIEMLRVGREIALSKNSIEVTHTAIKNAFDSNHSVLLPTGWLKHATYMEIIPTSHDLATIRLYNIGEGADLTGQQVVDFGEKISVGKELHGVERAKLLDMNILRAIYEINHVASHPILKTPTHYGQKDFDILIKILNPVKIEFLPTRMRPQGAGICCWQILLAVLKTHFEYRLFKQIKLAVSIESLYYVEVPKSYLRLTFNKSIQKTAKSVAKLNERKILTDDSAVSALKFLDAINPTSEEFSHFNLPLSKSFTPNVWSSEWSTNLPLPLNFRPLISPIEREGKIEAENKKAAASSYISFSEKVFHQKINNIIAREDLSLLKNALVELEDAAQAAWQEQNFLDIHLGLLTFIKEININDMKLYKIAYQIKSETTSQEIIAILGRLGQLFFKACFMIPQSSQQNPLRVYALGKFLHIQHQFFNGLSDLKKTKFSNIFQIDIPAEIFFKFPDAQALSDCNSLNRTWSPQFPTVDLKIGKITVLGANFSQNENTHWSEFVNIFFPDIHKKIFSNQTLALDAKETNAYIFEQMGQFPDWLWAMCTNYFSLEYLKKGPIGKLPKLDAEDCNWLLSAREKKTNGDYSVNIFLSGIDASLTKNHLEVNQTSSNLRFAGIHGEFSSPALKNFIYSLSESSDPLNEISRFERNNLLDHEKVVLPSRFERAQKFNLNDGEEVTQLIRLFTAKATRINEMCEYHQSQPMNLLERDHQIIFSILLFDPKIISMSKYTNFLRIIDAWQKLQPFLFEQYQLSKDNQYIQSCVFILRMRRLVAEIFKDSFPEPSKEIITFGISELKKFCENLKLRAHQPHEKSFVYAEILAAFTSREVSDEELPLIIEAQAYLHKFPVPVIFADPYQDLDGKQTVAKNQSRLAIYLKKNALVKDADGKNFMQKLSEVLGISDKIEWEFSSHSSDRFPSLTSKEKMQGIPVAQFFPLEGRMQFFGKGIFSNLPVPIITHPLFISLFPGVTQGIYIGINTYEFKDHKSKRSTIVSQSEKELLIDQEFDIGDQKQWLRFIPSSFFQQPDGVNTKLKSAVLHSNYYHWINSSNSDHQTLFFEDKENHHIIYTASLEKNSESFSCNNLLRYDGALLIDFLGNFTDLDLAQEALYFNTEIERKEKIEKEEIIHREIHFARLGLTFLQHKQTSFLESKEYPGFFIQERTSFLKDYKNCVIIKNKEGSSKLLLPRYHFTTPKKYDVHLATNVVDHQYSVSNPLMIPVDVIDFSVEGKLAKTTPRALIFRLIIITTALQLYKQAASLIKDIRNTTNNLNSEEIDFLLQLLNLEEQTGDTSIDATALRLWASYLLLKKSPPNQVHAKETHQTIEKQYALYLNKIGGLRDFKLNKSEEIFLLSAMNERNPLFNQRLNYLKPNSILEKPIFKSSVTEEETKKTLSIDEEILGIERRQQETSFKIPLITRLTSDFFRNHFFVIYNFLRSKEADEKDSNLKNAFRYGLTWLNHSRNQKNKTFAIIFSRILELGENAPAITTNDYEWKFTLLRMIRSQPSRLELELELKAKTGIEDFFVPEMSITPRIKRERLSLEQINKALSWQPHDTLPNLCSFNQFADTLEDRESKIAREEETPKSIMDHLFSPLSQKMKESPLLAGVKEQYTADELAFHRKNQLEKLPFLNFVNPEEISQALMLRTGWITTCASRLEKELLSLVNTIPSTDHLIRLKKIASKWKEWDLADVLANFAKQDPQELFKHNPHLTEEKIKELYQNIYLYLLYKKDEIQCKRASSLIEKYIASPSKELLEGIYKVFKTQNGYAHTDNKRLICAFMVFENSLNIQLRKEQVEVVKDFLKTKSIGEIKEIIMGWGKSKIIIPLLAFLKNLGTFEDFGFLETQEEALSLFIVPSALYESVAEETQNRVGAAFQQKVIPIHFERNTRATESYLQNVLEDLNHAMKKKHCVTMTDKSIKSLILKFIESFDISSKGDNQLAVQDLMRKILNIIKKNAIFDEADSIFNVLKGNLCYSMGTPAPPNSLEAEVIADLYTLLCTHPKLTSIILLNNNSPLPPELYETRIKKILAEIFIESLPLITERDSKEMRADPSEEEMKGSSESRRELFSNHPEIKKFFDEVKLSEDDHKNLLAYLTDDKAHQKSAQKFFDSQKSAKIQTVLATASKMIRDFLSHCLTQEYKINYGRDAKGKNPFIAVPFSAAKTPVPNSQFAALHVTMALIYQIYVLPGGEVPKEVLERLWTAFQNSAIIEMRPGKDSSKKNWKETKAGKQFELLCDGLKFIKFFNPTPEDVTNLLNHINRSVHAKANFVKKFIIPTLLIYPEQLTCTPTMLKSLFNSGKAVQGFTGTPGGISGSIHHNTKISFQPGNMTRIVKALLKKGNETIVLKDVAISGDQRIDATKGIPTAVLNVFKNGVFNDMKARAIIDVAGYFKNEGNAETASQMTEDTDAPTTFFDERSNMIKSTTSKPSSVSSSSVDSKNRKQNLFFDQLRSIGADLPSDPHDIALLTVGIKMTLDQMHQGAYRFRRIEIDQLIKLLLTESIASSIRQELDLAKDAEITYKEIFCFALLTQHQKKGPQNITSFQQQLRELEPFYLLQVLLFEIPKEYTQKKRIEIECQRLETFVRLRSTWFQPCNVDAVQSYGTLTSPQARSQYVIESVEKTKNGINNLFAELPFLNQLGLAPNLDEVDHIKEVMQNELPESILSQDNRNSSVEMTTEKTAETTAQMVKEAVLDSENKKRVLGCQEGSDPKLTVFSIKTFSNNPSDKIHNEKYELNQYLKFDFSLPEYSGIFSNRIHVTKNFLEWERGISKSSLLGENRTTVVFVQINQKSEKTLENITLLSQYDAESATNTSSNNVYNLTLDLDWNSSSSVSLKNMKKDVVEAIETSASLIESFKKDFAQEIVEISFLKGRLDYSGHARELLKNWLRKSPQKMYALCEKIIGYSPTLIKNFPNSDLCEIFKELGI